MLPRPPSLSGPLPAWDIVRRRADTTAVGAWILGQLGQWGAPAERLDRLHQHLDGPTARTLAKRLTASSLDRALRGPLHRLVRSVLPDVGSDDLWVQTRAHFRILVPGDEPAAVPIHTDHGFGHGLEERNLWIALTDAPGPGALHLCSLEESLQWLARTEQPYGIPDDAPEPRPIPAEAGDVLLFTPLHLHRARPPEATTRVSVDVRVIPEPVAPRDLSFSPMWRPE